MQSVNWAEQSRDATGLGVREHDAQTSESLADYDTLIDESRSFIGSTGKHFRGDARTQQRIRDRLIKSSFAYHYTRNKFYQSLCREQGVDIDSVLSAPVESIPAIPINLFKDQRFAHVLMTKGLGEIEFELRSTGTSGVPSVSRRDSDTVTTTMLALTALYRDFFSICNGCALFLCPSPAEMPEMGMVKALNLISGMVDDRAYLVNRFQFSSKQALEVLDGWKDRFTRHIVGPPFMINRLLQYMKNKDIRITLDKNTKIIMLGGWKRFTGEQQSPTELHAACLEYLGLQSHQVRDMYGLVECNMLAIECEHHHKHVPPWVRMVLRSVSDPKVMVRGINQPGIVTILDPTSTAYPCFVQTEDIGMITNDGVCACGRNSQTLQFIRRIEGAELGCCAINLERFVEDGDISRECRL